MCITTRKIIWSAFLVTSSLIITIIFVDYYYHYAFIIIITIIVLVVASPNFITYIALYVVVCVCLARIP